jgi:hypothetical protein
MFTVNHLSGFGSGGSGGSGNDAFTVLLLHCDGTDGSTTFTDSCAGATPHTMTANGNAQIDTAISKFGGAAGLFDGTGDYVSTPDSTDWTFGTGDFTVDCWFNRAGGDGTFRCMVSNYDATNVSFYIGLSSTNVVEINSSIGGVFETITGTTAFTATGWHHVAFVRTVNTLKLFVDGTQEGGDNACSGSTYDSTGALLIGAQDGPISYWNGSLDEIRISKGVARWTANFTPPTEAYG